MSRYTKEQTEDVAGILSRHYGYASGDVLLGVLLAAFADLFAADNPPTCINCAEEHGTSEVCVTVGSRCHEEHSFEGGFDRERFLAACGLEPEVDMIPAEDAPEIIEPPHRYG